MSTPGRLSRLDRLLAFSGCLLMFAGLPLTDMSSVAGSLNAPLSNNGLGQIDPSCGGGSSIHINESVSFDANAVLTDLNANDVTVIGVSGAIDKTTSVVFHAFTRDCSVDQAFGDDGVSRISHPTSSKYSLIEAMASGLHGTYLIVGSDGPSLIVGRMSSKGLLDTSFGDDGWATLSVPNLAIGPSGQLESEGISIVQAPSGVIYVGGNDGNAHCCVHAYVAALTPTGQLDSTFGDGGWVQVLPQGDYSTQLLVDPDGSVQVIGDVVYGGCGGPALTTLDPEGHIEPTSSNFESTLFREFPNPFMEAAFYQRTGGGLGVVSEVTSPCDGGTAIPSRSAEELIGLLPSGLADPSFGAAGYSHVPHVTVDSDSVWAIPIGQDGVDSVVAVAPQKSPFVPKVIQIRAFSSNGELRTQRGRHGLATFNLGAASHDAQYPVISAFAGPHRSVELVIAASHGVELTRLVG